ncbi:MAG TPA: ThuA domain-containing protein [Candidatus Acidoferrum sp.]|nr:ThuA domain-containing protein [Candidatus Acidoferrum sp.]
MKTKSPWGKLILSLVAVCLAVPAFAAEPKKVLVVSVTTGFRHSSIPTAERIIAQLGEKSGAYTVVDYARQPEAKVPSKPNKPKMLSADADAKAKTKYEADLKKFETDLANFDEAKAMSAQKDFDSQLKASMAKLSPEKLKTYDGIIFANTTGDLPLPDKQAFFDWIRNGGAFIGMHSATDTFRGHKPLDPYVEMIGGEFRSHGAQAAVEALVQDKDHPSCKHLGDSLKIYDEIYLLNSYNRDSVRELLVLDKEPSTKAPGHFPIAWAKQYGQGKIFYTSLGHREDVWDPEWKDRRNSKEVAEAYQKHILGGIKWALGLEPGSATPQSK